MITTVSVVPICAVVTILLMGDRLIARKKAKEQGDILSDNKSLELNFKKRNMVRIALMATITFFCLPWILALVGVYISDIPLLNLIFLGEQPYHGLPSVHLGEHHGWGGFLFSMMAIVGSISLDSKYYLKNKTSRALVAGGVVVMGWHAFFAGFEDAINEQILKRGIECFIYPFFHDTYAWSFYYPFMAIIGLTTAFLYYIYMNKKQKKTS